MKPLVMVGAGGHARELAWLVQEHALAHPADGFELIGFASSQTPENDLPAPLWGTDEALLAHPEPLHVAIGIGDPAVMLRLFRLFQANPNLVFPNIVHPRAEVHWPSLRLGQGNLVCVGCIVPPNVSLGNANCLNRGVQLGHDVVLGDANLLNPGAILSGGCHLGDANLVGTQAVALQYTRLGNQCKLGAGAVLTRSCTRDGTTLVGVPARAVNTLSGYSEA